MTRLRECRENARLSQKYVAITLGVAAPSVANWERGKTKPTPENMVKLADLYGVTTDYLMGRTDDPFPPNVRPVSTLHRQRVPLIGSVAAGEPIYDQEEVGVYVDSPVDADAAITIKGDSMIPIYQDGDIVYIKCRPDVQEGAVAVVFLDDEATIKHVYKRQTGLTLISDNPAYLPIMADFADYDRVRVFGVPVGYTRIYRRGYAGKIKKGIE